jgi:ABC-type uncharacterized transport system permease subunit
MTSTTQPGVRPAPGETFTGTVRRLAGAQKPPAKGSPAYSRFVNRKIGRVLAAGAFHAGLTPNHVTFISAGFSAAGIAVIALVRPSVAVAVLIPVLLLVAWTFGAHFQTQPYHVLLFVPSVLAAAGLRWMMGWALATAAFWTTRIHAIMHFYDRLAFVFAGQIAPLALLPGPLQALGYVLPFSSMLWAPAEILRGGPSPGQALAIIAVQLAWLGVTWAAFLGLWRLGVRQYSAVGA